MPVDESLRSTDVTHGEIFTLSRTNFTLSASNGVLTDRVRRCPVFGDAHVRGRAASTHCESGEPFHKVSAAFDSHAQVRSFGRVVAQEGDHHVGSVDGGGGAP